jgi:hypothetical protein
MALAYYRMGDITMMRQLFKPETIEYPGFAAFWSAYPRCPNKVAKGAARQMWNQIQPDEELQSRILQALDEQKRCKGWLKEEGQYIPRPDNWLRDERWDDEVKVVPSLKIYVPFEADIKNGWPKDVTCHSHHKPGVRPVLRGYVKVWACEDCISGKSMKEAK